MAKNKDINISPSKGISIVIKNDVQSAPIKPKKKRRYKRINVLPKTPAPVMQQSAGDTSYIKEQPGRFSLWRDNPTTTPVITLSQATTQGFIPQAQLPAPPQQLALPAPPQQLALPAPQIPFAINLSDYMRALMPQDFSKPEPRFKEIDNLESNDPFYKSLPDDKKEEYKNAKLDELAKNIDDTAAQEVEKIEKSEFYQNELTDEQKTKTIERSKYLTIQDKLMDMKEYVIKGIATRDINSLKNPRYPQNKQYYESYKKGLKNKEDTIKTKIKELDDIIAKETGQAKTDAEAEKLTKLDQLDIIQELYLKMSSEKKRIKDLLK